MKRVLSQIFALTAFWPMGFASEESTQPLPSLVHTEIRLFLSNGDKITGIVKNNRFCEIPKGKNFVESTPEEKGSGLRLFFIHDTKSYVFFPKEKFQRYERVRGLTEVEFRDLARAVEKSLRKDSSEESKKEPNQDAADSKAKDGKPAEKKLTPEEEAALARQKAQEAQDMEWRALLERFPSEAGWGEEYFNKIKKSRINGIYPNSEEAEFERQYPTWKRAFEWAEAERKRLEEEEKKKAASKEAPPAEKPKS